MSRHNKMRGRRDVFRTNQGNFAIPKRIEPAILLNKDDRIADKARQAANDKIETARQHKLVIRKTKRCQ